MTNNLFVTRPVEDASSKKTDPVAALDALLTEEHAALLKGDLDRIAELAEQKQDLADQLAQTKGKMVDLSSLQEKLARNHVLFDHALSGIRRVADRLDAIRALGKAMTTYDSTGQARSIPMPTVNQLERRA